MQDGMRAAYTSLIHSVAARDMERIEAMVEPNLAEAFWEFFDTLEEEEHGIEVVNEGTKSIKMEVLDFV